MRYGFKGSWTVVTEKQDISRRVFVQMVLGFGASVTVASRAFAKDGDGSKGRSGKGDDENEEENEDDAETISDVSPAPSSLNSNNQNSSNPLPNQNNGKLLTPDEVKIAIDKNNAATLPLLLAYVDNNFPGQVLDVRLRLVEEVYIYEVKLISNFVFLRSLRLDAKTMKKLQ